MVRGLVVGKFWPPHAGHHHLIRTAQAGCDHLTVMLCHSPHQEPIGPIRAEWLREIHPEVTVVDTPDVCDDDDSEGWARATVALLGYAPEVVYSSETYGPVYAGFMGSRHVMVDPKRVTVPMSGTQVRSNPWACWEYLEAPVRAHYALRVTLIGAESTGKTTLARALADELKTVWVPEYGREYSEEMLDWLGEYVWTSENFTSIAEHQCWRENHLARQANRVLICDTDAFATAIWHRRYMGSRSSAVEAIAAAHRRPDLYLLTDVNTPFVQDGTRDGEHVREWMHSVIVAELATTGRRWIEVSGTHAERLSRSLAAIDELLRGGPTG